MSSKELAGGCKARSGSDPWRGATLSVCVARFGASLLLSHKDQDALHALLHGLQGQDQGSYEGG